MKKGRVKKRRDTEQALQFWDAQHSRTSWVLQSQHSLMLITASS